LAKKESKSPFGDGNQTKTVLLVVLAVAAVGAAVWSGFSALTPEKGQAGPYMGDPDAPPPKQVLMEQQEAERQEGVEAGAVETDTDPGS
jgi:hypothetical protein